VLAIGPDPEMFLPDPGAEQPVAKMNAARSGIAFFMVYQLKMIAQSAQAYQVSRQNPDWPKVFVTVTFFQLAGLNSHKDEDP
jgi:hypothetical protein